MSGSTTPRLVVRESHDDQDQPSSSPTPTYSRPGSARVGVRGTPASALVKCVPAAYQVSRDPRHISSAHALATFKATLPVTYIHDNTCIIDKNVENCEG